MTAAAAWLVTPKFLMAATVVAGVAVTGALLQRTTATLPFSQAIELFLNEQEPEPARDAAGGRIYFDVAESIMVLRDLANSSSNIANSAQQALTTLLRNTQQPTAFVRSQFGQQLSELGDRLLAAEELSLAVRQQWLDELVAQVDYGIQAMHSLPAQAGLTVLQQNNVLHLQQIERMLAN